ncbi:MAG TPA: hypothetical protein VJM11_20090 [Nevskiaceae bacterium]|nr:hypothetical protein [Nevskiaceae bacterium]
MTITPKMLWLAVYGVFTSHAVCVGCSLSLKEIMESWPQSGLRRSDLGPALESLRRRNYIKVEPTDEGPRIRLVDEQFGLLTSGKEDMEAARALASLREARRRPTAHLATLVGRPDGRRSSDRRNGAQAAA